MLLYIHSNNAINYKAHTMQNTTKAVHTIYYTYNNKMFTTTTKACTLAQAQYAFDSELNSLNTFKLVRIVAQADTVLA